MLLVQSAFAVRHSPSARVAPRREICAQRRRLGGGGLLIGQQRLHGLVREAPFADQIADCRQCWNPNRPALCELVQRLLCEIRPMFDGVDPGGNRRRDRCVPVRMRHDGKACFMCNVCDGRDFIRGHRRIGQYAVVVEVHQTRDHDFDEVPAALLDLAHQRTELVERLISAADEAAVMAALVDREARRPVTNAVLNRDLCCKFARAPAVAAVPQKIKAERLVVFQRCPDERLVRRGLVPGERRLPVGAVQRHMNVTVAVHAFASFPAFSPTS